MTFKYRGEVVDMYKKNFPFNQFRINHTYKNPDGQYVYVNSHGYLHFLIPVESKCTFDSSQAISYDIHDYVLTRDGKMKFVKHRGYWISSIEKCVEKILAFHG